MFEVHDFVPLQHVPNLFRFLLQMLILVGLQTFQVHDFVPLFIVCCLRIVKKIPCIDCINTMIVACLSVPILFRFFVSTCMNTEFQRLMRCTILFRLNSLWPCF